MIRLFLTILVCIFSISLIAQDSKTNEFDKNKLTCDYKLKAPGLFSKVDSGQIAIIKIRNIDASCKNVSFVVMEYLLGVAQTNTGELSNCLKPNKKKKIKIYLENFTSRDDYDWIFSEVKVSVIENCQKK